VLRPKDGYPNFVMQSICIHFFHSVFLKKLFRRARLFYDALQQINVSAKGIDSFRGKSASRQGAPVLK
tara:strand:+ start:1388 stop:1591 length:204 start_codon:yes stop_codon:yes gene_type:complete